MYIEFSDVENFFFWEMNGDYVFSMHFSSGFIESLMWPNSFGGAPWPHGSLISIIATELNVDSFLFFLITRECTPFCRIETWPIM